MKMLYTIGCRKDIIILIDDSHGHDSHLMKNFIEHLTDRLSIGPNDVLVSVGTFTDHVNILWNLDTYTNKYDLDQAISNSHFYTSHSDHVNLDAALRYLLGNSTAVGNRANAEDVVFLVTHDGHHDDALLSQLHATYSDVFLNGGRNHLSDTEELAIASDSSHVIHWYHLNPADVYQRLAGMICS